MQNTILLTSFTTWKPHHTSNASDDLLAHISAEAAESVHFLRGLPVDFESAPRQVMASFEGLKPDILVCCGMAEERHKLSIESRAVVEGVTTMTEIDLPHLTRDLPMTQISHDAGSFVCNTLYFAMLNHLKTQPRQHHCLFAHVPVLGEHNSVGIEQDFLTILQRLGSAELAV
jgi:pyroglutamyl-peptidase